MVTLHDDGAVPAVARHQRQIGEQLFRTGGNGAVDAVLGHHLGDLLRGALVQIQADIRVPSSECTDHIGQDVPCLRVSGANGQASPALIAQLRREIPDALRLLKDPQRPIDYLLTGGCDPRQIPALAHEYLEAELILEQLYLLADAGL
jgi:hypothetical protein